MRLDQYTLKHEMWNTAVFAVFCAFASTYPHLVTFGGVIPIVAIAFSNSRRKLMTLLTVATFTANAVMLPFAISGEHPDRGDGVVATIGAIMGLAFDRIVFRPHL
ncbi:hypothetical protein Rcae01_04697 [Novipirellula caenicola]|uniref:Uncharacterized protein n=1 Tax=Novipirellula caenicola TaxID=1536901 RepID=A0ABP9VVL8_9BACT